MLLLSEIKSIVNTALRLLKDYAEVNRVSYDRVLYEKMCLFIGVYNSKYGYGRFTWS